MLSEHINIPQKELTETLTCTLSKQVGQNNFFSSCHASIFSARCEPVKEESKEARTMESLFHPQASPSGQCWDGSGLGVLTTGLTPGDLAATTETSFCSKMTQAMGTGQAGYKEGWAVLITVFSCPDVTCEDEKVFLKNIFKYTLFESKTWDVYHKAASGFQMQRLSK